MVIPKIGRGKILTGAKPSFREVLGKTAIQVKNGLLGMSPSLSILHPKGVSFSQQDVSVGKTWGTDLVAAAKRDARFVPFQLLTGMSSSAAPMFAMVGGDEGRGTSASGGKDVSQGMFAAGRSTPGAENGGKRSRGLSFMDHLTHEDLIVISGERVTQLVVRIRRSTPDEIPEVLMELALSRTITALSEAIEEGHLTQDDLADFSGPRDNIMALIEKRVSAFSGALLEGLTQSGLMDRTKQALLRYADTIADRMTLTLDTLHPDRKMFKVRVQNAEMLIHLHKALKNLLYIFELSEAEDSLHALGEKLRARRIELTGDSAVPYPYPEIGALRVLDNRHSPLGRLILRLYSTSEEGKIAQLLAEATTMNLTEADWNRVRRSNPQILDVLHERLGQIKEELLNRSVRMIGLSIEESVGKQRFHHFREMLSEGYQLVAALSAIGTPRETKQPHQYKRDMDYYEEKAQSIVGTKMGDIVFELMRLQDPEQILLLLDQALDLTPTATDWKNISGIEAVRTTALNHASHLLHVVSDAAARVLDNVGAERGQFLQIDVEEAHQRFGDHIARFKTFATVLERMELRDSAKTLREVANRRAGDVYAAMTTRSYLPSVTGDLVRQLRQADRSYDIIHILRSALRQELSADEWDYLLRSDSRISQAVEDVTESTNRALWGFRDLIESKKSQPVKERHSPLRGQVENAIKLAESTAEVFDRMGFPEKANGLRRTVRLVRHASQGLF